LFDADSLAVVARVIGLVASGSRGVAHSAYFGDLIAVFGAGALSVHVACFGRTLLVFVTVVGNGGAIGFLSTDSALVSKTHS
jgi:hypothetical protein